MALATARGRTDETLMARRKNHSAVEDLMELISQLPWWAGVGLAALSYLVLHAVSSAPVATPGSTNIGQIVSGSLWRTFAYAGQLVLPFICLIAALASALRQHERRKLLSQTTTSGAADALDAMSWQQFERLVGEGFRQQGYAVAETGATGPDGGVDLMLKKDGERFLVQCKQWRAFKVGVAVVRELYGVMAARGAAGSFVVTSGRFTEEAIRFAEGRNIRLIDGHALLRLIAQGSPSGQTGERAAPPRASAAAATAADRVVEPAACPICTKPMVRRVAKRGTAAGRAFLGCSSYPGCRGTRPI